MFEPDEQYGKSSRILKEALRKLSTDELVDNLVENLRRLHGSNHSLMRVTDIASGLHRAHGRGEIERASALFDELEDITERYFDWTGFGDILKNLGVSPDALGPEGGSQD